MRFIAVFACIPAAHLLAQASVTTMPLLPGQSTGEIDGLSADGLVAVGFQSTPMGQRRAYRWVTTGSPVFLDEPPGADMSAATLASSNGQLAAGWYTTSQSGMNLPVRWTASGAVQPLATLPISENTVPRLMNADGSVIAGWSVANGHIYLTRWTAANGFAPENLGEMQAATAISDDGSVIAGDLLGTAFRWTPAGGMQTLGAGSVTGMSADGATVALSSPTTAYRWTAGAGLQSLGLLPGFTSAFTTSISADGTVIFGYCLTDNQRAAFRWTQGTGMVQIAVPPANGSIVLDRANADGSIAVGRYYQNVSLPGVSCIWTQADGFHQWFTEYLQGLGAPVVGTADAGAVSRDGLTVAGHMSTASGASTCVFRRSACYANCDASMQPPVLNFQDFTCFLNRFASGIGYANCDRSTAPPLLNIRDFTCFLLKFATGCP